MNRIMIEEYQEATYPLEKAKQILIKVESDLRDLKFNEESDLLMDAILKTEALQNFHK